MTSLRRTLAVALLATGLALGTAVVPAAAASDPVLTVTVLPGQVRLIPGEAIELTLSTNRTTGYSWAAKVSGDKAAVKVGAGVYTAPDNTNGMVGVPGTTTWRITAKAVGKAVVSIVATPPGGGAGTTQKLTVIVMKG